MPASALTPFLPTDCFCNYWQFAAERQSIFNRRNQHLPSPWTSNQILQAHKFTNALRVLDRTSQFLLNNVIYSNVHKEEDLLFRILIFKFFNKIETWQLLHNSFGEINLAKFHMGRYDSVLSRHLERKKTIFSPAYIMPSGTTNPGLPKKHQNCLAVIQSMMRGDLLKRITTAKSLEQVYNSLIAYPMIGKFLAYQFAIDINYSPLTNFDENEFVVAGPGASRGIAKCIANKKGLTEAQIIRWMVENQDAEFARLGLKFEPFLGRKLHLIDCQNLFCEVDKYLRVARPDIQLHDRPMRIKQKFRPNLEPIDYMLPPKWVSKSQIAPRNEME